MKKVLIISYFFPPRPSIASLRPGGLAKYLPRFGWEPIILTAELPEKINSPYRIIETPYPGDASDLIKKMLRIDTKKRLDEGLGIPKALRESKNHVIQNILTFFYGFLIFPEEHKHWYSPGLKTAHDFLRTEKVDCILSSSSPITTHLIAKKIKDQYGIPWMADLRDLWTQNHYYLFGPIANAIEKRMELKTLAGADILATVSTPLVETLKLLHGDKEILSIPNGFNPDELGKGQISKDFVITYSGGLMQGKRDPEMLLQALQSLLNEKKIDPNKVSINFWGRKLYWLEQDIEKYGLQQIVHQKGETSRHQILEEQRNSQILLLLNWNDPREIGVYTGKTFEYLAAQRPILALGSPKGSVIHDLLSTTQTGNYPLTVEELKRYILKSYNEYLTTGEVLYNVVPEELNKFSHIEMARKFADALNKITKS